MRAHRAKPKPVTAHDFLRENSEKSAPETDVTCQVPLRLFRCRTFGRPTIPCTIPLAMQAPAAAPPPDVIIADRYRIADVLGHGGSSVVYSAIDQTTGARVAVKRLSDPDPTACERLIREARLLASLQSEHVTRLIDVGRTNEGDPYLVTQLVDGGDLGAYLRTHGPLPVRRAVDIVMQAASGLEAAHAHGVVHRDIKPGNILLARSAEGGLLVKLVDFGIARAASPADRAEPTLTDSGHLLGTPHYMAPEQIKNARAADARADIYSLGIILYRLLTNEYAFDGETAGEIIMNIATTPAPSLSAKRADVPATLDAIYRRCTAKSVNARVQTAAELKALLEGSLDEIGDRDDQPVVVGPTIAPTPTELAVASDPETVPLAASSTVRKGRWPGLAVVAASAIAAVAFARPRLSKAPTPIADVAPAMAAAVTEAPAETLVPSAPASSTPTSTPAPSAIAPATKAGPKVRSTRARPPAPGTKPKTGDPYSVYE